MREDKFSKRFDARAKYGSEGRRIKVPDYLRLPSPDGIGKYRLFELALSAGLLSAGASSQATLARATGSWEHNKKIDDYKYLLRDDLSQFIEKSDKLKSPSEVIQKTVSEFDASNHFESFVENKNIRNTDIVSLLRQVNARLLNGNGNVRNVPVYIRADSAGNIVEFPDARLCKENLRRIQAFFSENVENYPCFCSIVVFVGIIHCHPFLDGNGRSARTVFNILVRTALGIDHFLPISLISQISDGGFILKLRRAIYGAEWDKIVQFFLGAIPISTILQESAESMPVARINRQ